jgi:chromosome segregation ATPase
MFLVFAALLVSCNQQKLSSMEQEVDQLKTQNEMIRQQSASKDQFIEEYATTLNEVYTNLEKIREREGLITEYSKSIESGQQSSLKDKMLSNIESIDDYINRSKSRLSTLRTRFKESELSSKTFEQALEKLALELQEKENYIAELKVRVDDLNEQVTTAQFAIKERDLIIEEQTDQLHTAYYIIGTDEELEQKNIISEKGGILGFGKTKVVSSALDANDFNIADITLVNTVNINQLQEDIEIISEHAADSYDLISDSISTKLEIKNPAEFWKMRYLVIAVND